MLCLVVVVLGLHAASTQQVGRASSPLSLSLSSTFSFKSADEDNEQEKEGGKKRLKRNNAYLKCNSREFVP